MPAIIIGSRLDSTNYKFSVLPVSGADNGGSGTVIIAEAFRALVLTRFRSEVPVEFHLCAVDLSLAKTPSQNMRINSRTSAPCFSPC